MATLPLPLSVLCAVSVSVTSQGVTTPTFNQGLVIGGSNVIPSFGGTSPRIRAYASLDAMITDGFTTSEPEYLAMAEYFGQTPAPIIGWVGCKDPSAIAAAGLAITSGHAGTGYAVGDTFSITQSGATGGVGKVSTIGVGGSVTGLTVIEGQQGHGYATATGLATTAITGTGTGLQVDITAIGETSLEAVTACRLAQPAWYEVYVCGATDNDHLAIAAYIQAATPQCQYKANSSSALILSGASNSVANQLKSAAYSRTNLTYLTTQSGAYPNNAYAGAAVMGRAMGLNTGLAGSNFTLDAKNLAGLTPELLTLSQMGVIAGVPGQNTGQNCNTYVNFANSYQFFIQGVNCSGVWYDEILGLDMLAADAQLSVLNVLASLPSIPQTNAGQTLILNACNAACDRSATRGFLAGGVWNGPTILGLTAGTALPTGYLVQSDSYAKQSSGDRRLRKSMPVYISVILAGSQQSFTIGINVQE